MHPRFRLLAVLCLTTALAACGSADPPRVATLAVVVPSTHPWRDEPDPAPPPVLVPVVAAPPEPAAPAPTPTSTTAAPRVAPAAQPRVEASTVPPPVAQAAVNGDGCGGWRYAVEQYDWSATEACVVIHCESTFNPTATNGRYRGLLQIDGGSLDGETNLAQGYALWAETRTWRRWSCKP